MATCQDGDKGGEIKRKFEQVFKIMNNLKQSPFKNNVMREAMEVFYDSEFGSKLNANPWLIGFKNGIFKCIIHNYIYYHISPFLQ